MKTKLINRITITSLTLMIVFLLPKCKSPLKENEQLVLIDSLQLNNDKTLYWFYLADKLGGKSVSYLSISKSPCDISSSNAAVRGDMLYEINVVKKDSIFVTSYKGFEILKKTPPFVFVNKDFKYGQSFIRHGIKQEISIEEVCK